MSVPPDMLARMKQGGAPTLPGGAGAKPSPKAAPFSTPEKKEGKNEKARLQVHIGMNMLEQALGVFGAESKEGGVILKTLTNLARTFGENDTSDLVPAEMADIVSSMPSVGGGNPQQQMLMKQMSQPPQPAQMPKPPAPMPMPGAM